VSVCKNPSSPGCLKFNFRPGLNFCQACGTAASALGVTSTQSSIPAPTVSRPFQPTTPFPQGVANSPAAPVPQAKFVNVAKPQLNQQALKNGLMQSLQAQRAQRLPATVATGLMAASGVLLGIGLALVVLNVLGSGDEPNSILALLAGLLCIFLGWVVANWLPGSFRAAGVAAVNTLIPFTAIASLAAPLADGNLGLVLLFAALLSALVWVLPGTAGSPSIQGLGLAYASIAIVAFSVQSQVYGYINDLSNFEISNPFDFLRDLVSDSGTLLLILGGILLAVGHQLDRKDWSNVATPFVAIGILHVLAGAWSLQLSADLDSSGGATGMALLFLVVSFGITYIGGFAGRRFTLALGTWFITAGLVVTVIFVSGDSPSVITLALLMIIFAAGVSFTVFKLEPKLARISGTKP
jgi:hypothetical protein